MYDIASINNKKNNLGIQFCKGYDIENIIYVTQSCSTHNEKNGYKANEISFRHLRSLCVSFYDLERVK